MINAAATLASDLNAAAAQLTSVGSTASGEITSAVPQVNALTKTIAGLNEQIGQMSPNGDAGALEDQRQQAIEKLSALVGLDQVRTEGNGITLTTQGGSVLVAGTQSFALTAGSTTAGAVVRDSKGVDITAGITGGSIGGLVTVQSTDLPAATNALDSLAYQIATAVNAQNAAGKTTPGLRAAAIFSVPSSAVGSGGGHCGGGRGDGGSGGGERRGLGEYECQCAGESFAGDECGGADDYGCAGCAGGAGGDEFFVAAGGHDDDAARLR